MSLFESSGYIPHEKYLSHVHERILPGEFGPETVLFAMFALKRNRQNKQAAQHPLKLKSRAHVENGIHVVSACFLGSDFEEQQTFTAKFDGNGFVMHPETYVTESKYPAEEGYCRAYDDEYDTWLRQQSTGLVLPGSDTQLAILG